MKKVLSLVLLATVFAGCASTKGTSNALIQSGDVMLEDASSAVSLVQSGDVLL